MARPTRRWSRRASIGAVLSGVVSIGAGAAGMATANAAADPGSNFGSLSIATSAAAIRAPFYSHAGEDVAAEVPWAASTLQSGGVGRAITSVFWPGDTGGHGGDTLYLLGVPCIPTNPQGLIPVPVPCIYQPPQPPYSDYAPLNDPYKAEAQTGTGKPTVTNGGPGVDMTATAKQDDVSAITNMSGSMVPGIGDSFGATSAKSVIKLTGPNTAVIDALSTVHDVSLGGGAITISSITSVAHAVTNGKTGVGSASTTVNGMKVGGVPVTVDDKGIHVDGQGSALPSTDTLNKALAQSGFQIFVAKPTKSVKGASVNLDSGNLVFMQNQPQYLSNANDSGRVLVLGGAGIQADSSLGYPYLPLPAAAPPPVGAPPATSGAASAPAAGTPGALPQIAGSAPSGQTPVIALAHESGLPHGAVPAAFVVLVLLGSGLVAAGLRRLPDRVLATAGAACTLGGS
jgi:hypothetical protein